jgi:hypothetical protein
MASKDIRGNAGRVVALAQDLCSVAPNIAPMPPHIRLASKAPNGLPTTGFIFSMYDASGGVVVATAPGFTIVIWVWNPVAQRWQSFASKTSVNYDELYQSYDVDGGALLYFQITNYTGAGNLGVSICEQ